MALAELDRSRYVGGVMAVVRRASDAKCAGAIASYGECLLHSTAIIDLPLDEMVVAVNPTMRC